MLVDVDSNNTLTLYIGFSQSNNDRPSGDKIYAVIGWAYQGQFERIVSVENDFLYSKGSMAATISIILSIARRLQETGMPLSEVTLIVATDQDNLRIRLNENPQTRKERGYRKMAGAEQVEALDSFLMETGLRITSRHLEYHWERDLYEALRSRAYERANSPEPARAAV